MKEYRQEILVVNRKSGELQTELIPHTIKVAMRMIYGTGRLRPHPHKVRVLLKLLTVVEGAQNDKPKSAKKIAQFVAFHKIDMSEYEISDVSRFASFNEFFYRKLKAGMRPVPLDDCVAVSPADCRLNVFPSVDAATKLWIKGTGFTLEALTQSAAVAQQFDGGSIIVARLAPQDYHRFHAPVAGKVGALTMLQGAFYTVNPIAIRTNLPVFAENARCWTLLETKEFGDVLFVAVGATLVGSINYTAKQGDVVRRGDELGFFAFGGSTTIVVFKRGTIEFDHDLLLNSQKPIETLVQQGGRVGIAKNKK